MRAPKNRQGDRSSVFIIGPTRCGKSAQTISSLLTCEIPAIVVSPKTDLIIPTVRRRLMLGEIKIFDPSGLFPCPNEMVGSWTPLRRANTISGAMDAARTIIDGAERTGGSVGDFWYDSSFELLWPMLFAAAQAHLSMADVADWVARQDQPTSAADEGAVSAILDQMMVSPNSAVRSDAAKALTILQGKWALADNTRSSIYATLMSLVKPWHDPMIAAACGGSTIDLDWLLDPTPLPHDPVRPRANTLYVTERDYRFREFSVVFGSLIKDLVDQQMELSNRTGRPPRDVLLVMDEAGNTPVRWLPEIASICAGHGIQLVTIWQSFAQIHALYSQRAGTVVANHGTKIMFSGISDEETIRYAGAISGEAELTQTSVSSDRQWGSAKQSIQESARATQLVPGWLLRQIPIGEALLIHGTLPPAHLRTIPWYRDKGLQHLAATGRPPSRGPWSRLYKPPKSYLPDWTWIPTNAPT